MTFSQDKALTKQAIGVFGGTFDPVHNAHLRIALDVLELLGLVEIRFIPSHRPPHRGRPGASAEQRLAMLEQAVSGQAGFAVDERELQRKGPSYSVDTLTSLRSEQPDAPLCLILGLDAFLEFHTWHQWQLIPELAHIIVLRRPHVAATFSSDLQELMRQRQIDYSNAARLHTTISGHILLLTVTQLSISATMIRELVAQNRSPRYLLPDAVYDYICQSRLYLR